jgi:hypothetical protein
MQSYLASARDALAQASKLATEKAAEIAARQKSQAAEGNGQQLTSTAMPPEARVARFKSALLATKIDLAELRRLAYNGVPDKDGLRAITWKVGRRAALLLLGQQLQSFDAPAPCSARDAPPPPPPSSLAAAAGVLAARPIRVGRGAGQAEDAVPALLRGEPLCGC